MVFQALKKVFVKPAYIVLGIITSVVVFVFAVWFINISLIIKIIGSPGISFAQKINIPISLLGSISTNFSLLSAFYTITMAILFGLNLSMIVFVLKRRVNNLQSLGVGTGFWGITSGALGIGCAACGSFILISVLSLVGASWVFAYLPLNGGEFGILGLILLMVSLYLTAKKIMNPMVCKIQ